MGQKWKNPIDGGQNSSFSFLNQDYAEADEEDEKNTLN